MLQCLAQFCVPLLQFFEQPDVLDSDDGLSSEGLKKLDLLVGKGTNLCAPNDGSHRWEFPLAVSA